MTKSATLTQVVAKAEVTPEQKHQRVIDWLNEVHKVLYKNLDLSKHSINLKVTESNDKGKFYPRQSHTPVHRLYTQADHEHIRNTCNNRNKTREKQNGYNRNQLPTIPKRHFSSSNSSQPSGFQRKNSVQPRPPITSKVIRSAKHDQVTKPIIISHSPRKTTPTFRRRLRSAAPLTAG